jgi:hypothetical protein
MLDEVFCQLLHGRWARVISYSRQGAWECVKPDCAAQARHNAAQGRQVAGRGQAARRRVRLHSEPRLAA